MSKTLLAIPKRIVHTLVAVGRAVPKAAILPFLLLVLMAVLFFASERTLTVLPVSIPSAFVDAGYSPDAASQAVAERIASMADTGIEYLNDPAELTVTLHLVPAGALDLADIQMPGQAFSFRDVYRFIRGVFGNGDPAISITIVRSGSHHVVRATAVGGEYAGRRKYASVPSDASPEDVMMTAAAIAVSVVEPLRYAAFLDEISMRDDITCPMGTKCTAEDALTLVGQLLADDYLQDDGFAHLLYGSISLNAANRLKSDTPDKAEADLKKHTANALQHCEAAARYGETRDWAKIFCSYSHMANNDMYQAKKIVFGALPVRSKDPDLHAAFGDLFLEFNLCTEAQKAYNNALALDRRHAYSLVGLGTIDLRNKLFAEAAKHYQEALLINPNEPHARKGKKESLDRTPSTSVCDA